MAQVTKDTTIGELLSIDPNTAAILMRMGTVSYTHLPS